MDIFQVVIGVLGVLALFYTIRGYTKIGSLIGLISQPFWIVMSLERQLWGVFVVSIAYLGVWIYGLVKD
jgi:hypothetical protein